MAQPCERFMMDVTDSKLGPEQRCKICKQQKQMHQTSSNTKNNVEVGSKVAQLAQKFSQAQQTVSPPQYKKQPSNSQVPQIIAPKLIESIIASKEKVENTITIQEQIKQANSINISNQSTQFTQDKPTLSRQNVDTEISSQKIQQPTQEQSIPMTQSQPTQLQNQFEKTSLNNPLKKADSDIIPEKEPEIQQIKIDKLKTNNQTNIMPIKQEIVPTISKPQIIPPKIEQTNKLNIPIEGGVRDKAKSIALNFVPFGQAPPQNRSKSAQREPEQAQQIPEQLLERPAPRKNHRRTDENFITDE